MSFQAGHGRTRARAHARPRAARPAAGRDRAAGGQGMDRLAPAPPVAGRPSRHGLRGRRRASPRPRPTGQGSARRCWPGGLDLAGAGDGPSDRTAIPGPGQPITAPLAVRLCTVSSTGCATCWTAGGAGESGALRHVLNWTRVFGRWNAFSWDGSVLERRVANLAVAGRRLTSVGPAVDSTRLADSLARQTRRLLQLADEPSRAAERLTTAATAGRRWAGEAGERLLGAALAVPGAEPGRRVLADGVHASRSPQAGMELLFDLLTLDDALVQRGRPARPEALPRAIDRPASPPPCASSPCRTDGWPPFRAAKPARRRSSPPPAPTTTKARWPSHCRARRCASGYQRLDGPNCCT